MGRSDNVALSLFFLIGILFCYDGSVVCFFSDDFRYIIIIHMNYWFRPTRFWKWFAFYYPASKEGWLVTIFLFAMAGGLFYFVESRSHSVSDTLLGFAPWLIALASVFDLLCFRRGEYPSWWRRENDADSVRQGG